MKTGTAIYRPGEPMDDLRPAAHRIRSIRNVEGELLGFGMTAPGGKTIVKSFPAWGLGACLAALNETCDFIYGPVRADRRVT